MPFISSIRKNYDTPTNNNNFEVTGGDSVYTAGGYRIHTFTTAGAAELVVKNINTPSNIMQLAAGINVEYLVIAGGGAGRGGLGGGGGAGGLKTGITSTNAGSVPVFVGAGVTGSPGGSSRPLSTINQATSTNNSNFGTVTCDGGGAAGSHREPSSDTRGYPGGSGGGGGTNGFGAAGNGVIGQGFPGGHGSPGPSHYGGGGGGGAGEKGGDVHSNTFGGAKGGNGVASAIDGVAHLYAGGGGGGSHSRPTPSGSGGLGGGGGGAADLGNPGNGAIGRNPGGTAARANGGPGGTNTGAGGGGGDWNQTQGGTGGPGIVLIRYRI
mgnify:CR=1 FL=1